MKWSVMELIPSNTTHLSIFSFPLIWGVSNGMEHVTARFSLDLFYYLFMCVYICSYVINCLWVHFDGFSC